MSKIIAKAFDIECIPNLQLISECFASDYQKYNRAVTLGEVEDKKYKNIVEFAEAEFGENNFLPPLFHSPVVISVASICEDESILGPSCLSPSLPYSSPLYSENLVREFWKRLSEIRVPVVTYNGRGYDFPVLESWAIRLGINISFYFKDSKRSYRHRYGPHIDMRDQLSNHGAVRRVGAFDWYLKSIGCRGKGEVDGTQVWDLWKKEEYEVVENYCNDDVLQLCYGFLAWKRAGGDYGQ